jgi:hypothetical protein
LEPAATAGGLSGIVRSQSGEYAGQLLVFLRDTRGALVGVYPTTWKLDVERGGLAPFAFDAVPSGGLSVDVVSLQDEVGFSLNPSALVAPNSEVDILLLDQEPACDWNFRIVNAIEDTVLENVNLRVVFEDGRQRRYMGEWKHAPEPGASAYTWTRIAGEMRWNEFEGPAVLQGLSERARFTWTVRAEGFAPATGDQDALDDDGKGGRSMVVRLKPIDPSNEKIK